MLPLRNGAVGAGVLGDNGHATGNGVVARAEKTEKAETGGSDGARGKSGLTAQEIARYSRHLLVPAVGVEGQR